MKETILHTPKTLSFSKRIVKHLPQAVRNGLPAEISVVSVSEQESRLINRRYRHRDKPANVLSFLYRDTRLSPRKRESRRGTLDSRLHGNDKRDKEKEGTYGEIIVCPSVIRREARAQKHSFAYQMTWMILHGMIHLTGLHHERSGAAEKRVARMEKEILQTLFQKRGSHDHHRA